ncbi:hypothetical protein Tco_0771873 [Tanacetum coccineum]|uniref:Uncharacterized protein n=1 Tax=Tanacetum coccineum TaxID=301880 RepID=A0ABQ4ZHD8_9ASTR
MIQYLKNTTGYSHAQLKDKSFDEVQKLFEKHMKWINSFVPMEEDLSSKKVQKEVSSEKKAEGSSRKKLIGRKRAKDKKEQESSKRQRVEDDKEEEELKKYFKLAKEEEIAINAIPLATKVPIKVKYGDLYNDTRYPLTPITITNMLNKKLQADQWNEMVYQLLKLMIQKMNMKFRGGLLGLKGFLKLLLLSTAGTKVNAVGLKLLEELLLNKEEIGIISLDDLYNNLKIYEPELAGSSSTSQNPQNVAFVSSNSTNNNSSTNEANNTTYGVSAAHTQTAPTSKDNLSDAVICAFQASQPNSPQLAREDLEQIDLDDLEEMDL